MSQANRNTVQSPRSAANAVSIRSEPLPLLKTTSGFVGRSGGMTTHFGRKRIILPSALVWWYLYGPDPTRYWHRFQNPHATVVEKIARALTVGHFDALTHPIVAIGEGLLDASAPDLLDLRQLGPKAVAEGVIIVPFGRLRQFALGVVGVVHGVKGRVLRHQRTVIQLIALTAIV